MKKWETVKEYKGFKIQILQNAEAGDIMDYRISPSLQELYYSNVETAIESIDHFIDNVKGFHHLTEEQKNEFVSTYRNHLEAMGHDPDYQPSQLKEVSWDEYQNCFKVYWQGETDWFHYKNGKWY